MEISARPSFTPKALLNNPAMASQFYDEPACKALAQVAAYVSYFLTAPDPMLGRSGAVCPFVSSALLDDMITLSVLPVRTGDATTLRQAALSARMKFDAMQNNAAKSESLRAVIILLPYVEPADAVQMIETVQKALKPDMVASGLMIGEFYPGCALPGLNNPAFRPADTSIPFLAIRRMTAGDLPFLVENADYLDHYLSRFGKDGKQRLIRLQASRSVPVPEAVPAGIVAQAALPAALGRSPSHAG